MSLFAKLKRLYTHMQVMGTYWPDYRDAWLSPVRKDGGPDRVLDAGCGQGEILSEFRRFGVPVDYYGVDLGVGDPSWEFKVSALADLHQLPFRSGSFDKIICNQVLEHLDEPDSALRELARVLRPGGRAFISVPFVWHLHQEPYDRYRFTRTALEYLIEKHGLKADLICPMGGYFSVLRYFINSHMLVSEWWPQPWRTLTQLAGRLVKFLDRILIAPACYWLDQLDRDRKLTLGYFLHLSRPGAGSHPLPEDPYCCPRCVALETRPLIRGAETWSCFHCATSFEVRAGVPVLTLERAYRPVTDRILTSVL
ncbi:MAG TPA: class I SAM-dependent methyltransferase [Blastocatellia bacterium]|nr:class I SAM-dependent methyltransferase [Blastocatellia bacterium]